MMKFPQCTSCKHLDRDTIRSIKSTSCKAFPNGIPMEVWDYKHDHTQPYPGDNGKRIRHHGILPFIFFVLSAFSAVYFCLYITLGKFSDVCLINTHKLLNVRRKSFLWLMGCSLFKQSRRDQFMFFFLHQIIKNNCINR